MKYALVTLLFAAQAQAQAVTCNVNASTKRDDSYDKILFSQEITESRLVVIKDGAALEINSNADADWKSLDQQTIVSFGPQEGGLFGVSLGRIEVRENEPAFKTEGVAVGAVDREHPLSFVSPGENLSIICLQH